MWADEVVGLLPVVDQRVQLLDGAGQVGAGVELAAPRAIASLDVAVELRHARRLWQRLSRKAHRGAPVASARPRPVFPLRRVALALQDETQDGHRDI